MPWYDYACEACAETFEAERTVAKRDDVQCPRCATSRVRRTLPRIHAIVRSGAAEAACPCGETDSGCGCCGSRD